MSTRPSRTEEEVKLCKRYLLDVTTKLPTMQGAYASAGASQDKVKVNCLLLLHLYSV